MNAPWSVSESSSSLGSLDGVATLFCVVAPSLALLLLLFLLCLTLATSLASCWSLFSAFFRAFSIRALGTQLGGRALSLTY